MKKITISIVIIAINFVINAQDNKIEQTGNVGIGTTNPQEKLHILKRSLPNDGQVHDVLMIQANTDGNRQSGFGARINFSSGKYGNIAIGTSSSLGAISVYDANNESSYGTMAFATKERYDKELINKMWLDRFGNLGIGTANPNSKLEILESGSLGNNTDVLNIIKNTGTAPTINTQVGLNLSLKQGGNPSIAYAAIRAGEDTGTGQIKGALSFLTQNYSGGFKLEEKMRIQSNGNVGIGTTNPDMKLTVKGNIHAEEVKIDLNVPAPDYVFKEDYNLRSIEDVENFIKENNHLPEIPSAKEFEQNGVMQAEMDMNLLKKIEELTLYTIQQEKKIKELESLNDKLLELQSRLEKLESEK